MMIKQLTIVLFISLAFFFGLVIGFEYSPRQECVNSLSFMLDKFKEKSNQLDTCKILSWEIINKFFEYKDDTWQLRIGLEEWEQWYNNFNENYNDYSDKDMPKTEESTDEYNKEAFEL